MSDEATSSTISSSGHRRWIVVTLIGMSGYLLGSFFPAGYIRYLIQSKLFPETLAYQEPTFDRSKLRGAVNVKPSDLTNALDANPALFEKAYLDKPVRLTGTVRFFLEDSSGNGGLTLTLETGGDYRTGVIMTFDDKKDEKVVALRQGGSVTATCMASGTTSDNVHLTHCEIS